MQWIVENITNESSYNDLIKEIKRQEHPLKVIKNGFKFSDLDEFREGAPCALFLGSIELTEIVKKQIPNCFPLAYCTPENYLCTRYMSYFGDYLFNDRYSIISLSELNRQKFFFYGLYGKEAMIFIRPDSGQKPFQAKLIDLLDFDRFYIENQEIKHDLVVVSTPKNITWEGRIVVSKEYGIIATSTYRYQGQITRIPSVPQQSIDLCNKLLKIGYYPDKVFCMDFCQDFDGKFWLLEINSFSSAGLYECNKEKIVKIVSDIAEKDYKENFCL